VPGASGGGTSPSHGRDGYAPSSAKDPKPDQSARLAASRHICRPQVGSSESRDDQVLRRGQGHRVEGEGWEALQHAAGFSRTCALVPPDRCLEGAWRPPATPTLAAVTNMTVGDRGWAVLQEQHFGRQISMQSIILLYIKKIQNVLYIYRCTRLVE
jgi:hypothetical protein